MEKNITIDAWGLLYLTQVLYQLASTSFAQPIG